MYTPRPPQVVLLLAGLFLFTACASQPKSASNQKLKLETITRPFGPTTYLYRATD